MLPCCPLFVGVLEREMSGLRAILCTNLWSGVFSNGCCVKMMKLRSEF